jgi:hypothetical protein
MKGAIAMAEWRYVKPLPDENLLKKTEEKLGFKFSDSYVAFVKKYNGGRPPINTYDTDKTKERTIKSFLSLNPTDAEAIVNLNKYVSEISREAIAFAIDSFGNYICFDKANGAVVFLDFETGDFERIADNFDAFLKIIGGGIN